MAQLAHQLLEQKDIVAEAVVIVVTSVVAGIAGALVGARFVTDLLYETSAADPLVLALVAILLVAGGIVASAFPAWRASRVDPMVALRAE
jgi:putative ABC transport system permease protein